MTKKNKNKRECVQGSRPLRWLTDYLTHFDLVQLLLSSYWCVGCTCHLAYIVFFLLKPCKCINNRETWKGGVASPYCAIKDKKKPKQASKNANERPTRCSFPDGHCHNDCLSAFLCLICQRGEKSVLKVVACAAARCDLRRRWRASPVQAVTANLGTRPHWQPHYSDNSPAAWKNIPWRWRGQAPRLLAGGLQGARCICPH